MVLKYTCLDYKGGEPFPPQYAEVTPASVHDLAALRDTLSQTTADVCILDKAHSDVHLAKQMLGQGSVLLTPRKDKKGWEAVLKQRE